MLRGEEIKVPQSTRHVNEEAILEVDSSIPADPGDLHVGQRQTTQLSPS